MGKQIRWLDVLSSWLSVQASSPSLCSCFPELYLSFVLSTLWPFCVSRKQIRSILVIFRLHNSVIWYFIINVFVCVCFTTVIFFELSPMDSCIQMLCPQLILLWRFMEFWRWGGGAGRHKSLGLWDCIILPHFLFELFVPSVQLKYDVLASWYWHQDIIPWQISSTLVTSQKLLLLKLGFGSMHIIIAKEK